MSDQLDYYTVLVPWAPRPYATEWHPTTSTGPFSTLTRGAFPTWAQAYAWASTSLNGCPYEIRYEIGE